MDRTVLSLPIGKSSEYTHKYGVYSIQLNRVIVEPYCQNPDGYLTFREAGGGHMHWLYQVVSPAGLVLDPQQPLAAQLVQLGIRLPIKQQVRLSSYMQDVTTNLQGAYRKVQRFYILTPQQDSPDGCQPPLGPLPHKPHPTDNNPSERYYSLEELLNKKELP